MSEIKSIICIMSAIGGSQLLWLLSSFKAAENYYQYGFADVLLAVLFAAAAYTVLTIKEKRGAAQHKPAIKLYKPEVNTEKADRIA